MNSDQPLTISNEKSAEAARIFVALINPAQIVAQFDGIIDELKGEEEIFRTEQEKENSPHTDRG